MVTAKRVGKWTTRGIVAFVALGVLILYFNHASIMSQDQAIISAGEARDRLLPYLAAQELSIKSSNKSSSLDPRSNTTASTFYEHTFRFKSEADREVHLAYLHAASNKYNTSKCSPYKCQDKVCMEDLICIGENLKSRYLPNYRNPCFYEKVIDGENMDQNVTMNLIIRRMVADPLKNAGLADFQRHWNQKRSSKYQLRCLPYFFLIGMEKCGTTDLYKRMGYHPQIELSPAKELQWWTRRRFFSYVTGTFPKEKQSDGYKISHPEELIAVPISHYYTFLDKAASTIQRFGDKNKPASFELREHEDGSLEEEPKVYHSMITGDGSPNIMYWNDFASLFADISNDEGPKQIVAQQIHSTIPQARIIAILRNPVDRLYSSYLFFTAQVSADDFHRRVGRGIEAMEKCCTAHSLRYCVYDPTLKERIGSTINIMQGIYSVMIDDWYKLFPSEQIHIIHFETYKGNELNALNGVFQFLGLSTFSLNDQIGQRVAQQEPQFTGKRYGAIGPMHEKTRNILAHFYAKYNKQLAERLNNTAFLWDSS